MEGVKAAHLAHPLPRQRRLRLRNCQIAHVDLQAPPANGVRSHLLWRQSLYQEKRIPLNAPIQMHFHAKQDSMNKMEPWGTILEYLPGEN